MPSPFVSVIIPSYNHARFLKDAVNSVLRQSFEDLEVVIVDDCSIDGSQEVIRSFKDPRIKHMLLDTNRGACAALNIGLELSKAGLVAICNSDDMWVENKLERQLPILANNPRVGAVFTDVSWIDERGNQLDKSQIPFIDVFAQPNRSRASWIRFLVEVSNCLCHPSVLIRREVYEDCGLYDLRYRQLPDLDMWLRALQKYNIFVMPEKAVLFRRLDNNQNTAAVTPSNSTRSINETYLIFSDFFENVDAENFASSFGTIKSLGDPQFCLPLEKVLYLITTGGFFESIFKSIGQKILFTLLKETDALLYLYSYRLPFDSLWQLMGISSPWLNREELGPLTDKELQFLSYLPQRTRGPGQTHKTPTSGYNLESYYELDPLQREEQERVNALSAEYSNLLKSNSWRITKHLRICKSVLVGLASSQKGKEEIRPAAVIENAVDSFVEDEEFEIAEPNVSSPEAVMTENMNTLEEAALSSSEVVPVLSVTSAQIQTEIDAIKNSLSWKVSSPIRALKTSLNTVFRRSLSTPPIELEQLADSHYKSATSSQTHEIELAIFDDFFPCELSGFRYEEFSYLLENIENSVVFTTGASLPAVGLQPEDIYSLVYNFQTNNPGFAGKVRIFNDSLTVKPKMAYCLFLSLADRYLPFFEKHQIPFAFTLYPGGALRMGEQECDDMIRRVCSSKQFRGLITTQRLVSDYLRKLKVCSEDRVTEVIGAVVPREFEATPWSEKVLFGKHKDTIDICFVAHKYTEFGQDKGYDLFVQFALQQASRFPNLRFHVIGGFDETVLDVSEIQDKITFYGKLNSGQMLHLFRSMDLILSPNDGRVRGGEVDGFPTACCMQAGMSGVAVFCTDFLNQNVLLKPERDFVLIDRDLNSLSEAIEPFLQNPSKLYDLALQGQKRFRECYGRENQLNTRLSFVNRMLSRI